MTNPQKPYRIVQEKAIALRSQKQRSCTERVLTPGPSPPPGSLCPHPKPPIPAPSQAFRSPPPEALSSPLPQELHVFSPGAKPNQGPFLRTPFPSTPGAPPGNFSPCRTSPINVPPSPGTVRTQEQGLRLPLSLQPAPQGCTWRGRAAAFPSPCLGLTPHLPSLGSCWQLFSFCSKRMKTEIRAIREKSSEGKAGASTAPNYQLQEGLVKHRLTHTEDGCAGIPPQGGAGGGSQVPSQLPLFLFQPALCCLLQLSHQRTQERQTGRK